MATVGQWRKRLREREERISKGLCIACGQPKGNCVTRTCGVCLSKRKATAQ